MARIAVIDDSPTVLVVMKHLLGRAAHDVTTAATLAELTPLLEEGRIDLVMLDLEMVWLAGADLKELGERCRAASARVVIHSSHDGATVRQAASDVQATGVIRKGLAPGDLVDAVHRMLSAR